jgi:serine/threonine-protein kinase
LPPEKLDAAERALAFHLGPIAKVLVRKAAAQSSSVDELHERLAGHLNRDAEKTAFFAAIGRR